MNIFGILFLGFSFFPAMGWTQTLRSGDEAEVNRLVDEIFAEVNLAPLRREEIVIVPFESRDALLQAHPWHQLQVSPRLFDDPTPPTEGLKAILVHELYHLHDYAVMGPLQLARFGLHYALDDEWVRKYERFTDQRALCQGYAAGLKAYRIWLYPRFSIKDRLVKLLNYYRPAEIDAFSIERSCDGPNFHLSK